MRNARNIILKHIHNQNAVFVFSTDIAATTWEDYIVEHGGVEAIATQRFIAWDSFKSKCIKTQHQSKTSIPSVLRKFFAANIIEKNKNKNLFSTIINPHYIQNSTSFSSWIAGVLPQLASWEERVLRENIALDDEDKDFLLLKSEYEKFLEKNMLFDPSWERPPFHTSENTYFIIYPEVIQDFSEYKEILYSAPSIEIISIDQIEKDIEVIQYTNVRSELRDCALFIKNACSPLSDGGKGLSWGDVAVSVKDLDTFEPYIRQEFALYNIPIRVRSGKQLTSYAAGRLFPLIQNCYTENFSFDSVKTFLLDPVFPWKDMIVAKQLIDFGIKNNCLCSYDGVDIWENAFKSANKEERAREFYKSFKKSIISIATSTNFFYLREHYMAFKKLFFLDEKISEAADIIISRCISELTILIELESSFTEATACKNPLSFFIEHLQTKDYVVQTKENGVNLFTYKLASSAPFKQHIILDSSQNALTVSNHSLSFLRDSKRKQLGLVDESTSTSFVSLYTLHSTESVRFSFSQKSFSGFEIPYNALKSSEIFMDEQGNYSNDKRRSSDPYQLEKNLFLNKDEHIQAVHAIQRSGLENWLATQYSNSIFDNKTFLIQLKEKIFSRYINNGKIQVSATTLKEFYTCPVQWLFKKVLNVSEFTLESNLLDDEFVGTFNHEVIKRLLTKFKIDNKALYINDDNSLPIELKENIIQETRDVVKNFPGSCGITNISELSIEVFKLKEDTYIQKILEFFTEFLLYFSGSYVSEIEKDIIVEYDEYRIVGRIDCVLDYPGVTKVAKSKGADTVEFSAGKFILDFKTGLKPSRKQCIKREDQNMEDFQLPLYTYIYEEFYFNGKALVQGASYFSINGKKPTPIFGLLKKGNSFTPRFKIDQLHREGLNEVGASFEPTMSETMLAIEKFVHAIQDDELSLFTNPKKWGYLPNGNCVKFDTCLLCGFKKICRSTYTVSGAPL